MHVVKIYEMTEIYRILDSIKEPSDRVKVAKEKTLTSILETVEGISSWKFRPVEAE